MASRHSLAHQQQQADGRNLLHTQGGAWSQALNGALLTTPPYDTDGDPSTFSDTERADIAAIHSAVAEDFAIWDVDVTTADPGVEGVHRCVRTM